MSDFCDTVYALLTCLTCVNRGTHATGPLEAVGNAPSRGFRASTVTWAHQAPFDPINGRGVSCVTNNVIMIT
jgi:hypothetical protein